MAKFKIGDRVKCIDFEGATGLNLRELGDVPLVVSDIYRDNDKDFISVNSVNAYASRFVLEVMPHDLAVEYEETMEFERLVNG